MDKEIKDYKDDSNEEKNTETNEKNDLIDKEIEKESEISGKSPVITEENKKELLESIKAIKAGDVLVLSGSVPKTMGNEIYRDM